VAVYATHLENGIDLGDLKGYRKPSTMDEQTMNNMLAKK